MTVTSQGEVWMCSDCAFQVTTIWLVDLLVYAWLHARQLWRILTSATRKLPAGRMP